MQNDESNAKKLLKIVSKLKWIKNKDINDYFVRFINKNYSSDMAFLDFKEQAKSSSTRLIAFISGENLCNDEQILKKSSLNASQIKFYNKIFLIDDYIGSGQTMIEALDEIKEKIIGKEIYIVTYAIQKKAIEKIKQYDSNIIISSKLELDTFEEEYEKAEIDYIKRICINCPNSSLTFGHNGAGAIVVLNQIAPNSDISMLWYPSMKNNNKRWIPLLSREIGFQTLNKKNKEIISKNTMYILEGYKNFPFRNSISLEEFEFLIYTFGCYNTVNQLLDNNYFETEEEFNLFTKKLVNENYIDITHGYITISNLLIYKEINKIIDFIYRENNRCKKAITSNI